MTDDPATPPVGGSLRKPDEAAQDNPDSSPGDGTLPGSVPAGLTVDELRRRAERSDQPSDDGGTG